MTAQTSDPKVITDHHHPDRVLPPPTTGAGLAARLLGLPRTVKIVGGAAIGLTALLAAGVPLATLGPLVALGGCLGMHLLMGHGMSHGGHVNTGRESHGSAGRGDSETSAR